MKNLNTHHHIDDINAIPEAACTQSLYAAFAAGMSRARSMIGKRGAWRAAQALRRQLRQIYKTEKTNFELWLRRKLRVDASWRQRVLKDLGGHAALRRWYRRAANAAAGIHTPKNPRQTSRSRSNRSPASGTKPANLGLYRLASIKSGTPTAHSRRYAGSSSSRYTPLYPTLKPIEITPDDLRSGGGAAGCGSASIDPDTLWLSMITHIITLTTDVSGLEADILQVECMPALAIVPTSTSTETGPAPQGLAARVATAPG